MPDSTSTNLQVTMLNPDGTSEKKADVFSATCPSRHALQLVANKWTLLIVHALRSKPMRNGELMRKIEGISQKVLTRALRDLQLNGLVDRIDHSAKALHVEYRLTALGASLSEVLIALDQWVETHHAELLVIRQRD